MNFHFIRVVRLISIFLFPSYLWAQYPPPAGHAGTTAMDKDSAAFISWAATCTIEPGYINISDTSILYEGSNKPTYGSYLYGSGPADELVVSLGDNGSALLGFDIPIVNRTGPDFAVFENSFGDAFLELGFVEVSSDGAHFVRFPTVSLTSETQQVNTFDTIDATKIHNFAGKYRHGFGTPFDLEDLKDSIGIDLNNIISIRIIDAIGCIQAPFATTDAQGHKVNDPWPTPFDTGGFDFDAIGVINNKTQGADDLQKRTTFRIYPNPSTDIITFESRVVGEVRIRISDPAGRVMNESLISKQSRLDISSFPAGIYMVNFTLTDGTSNTHKIVKY